MKETYDPELKAHVLTDDNGQVRAIRHTQEYWKSPVRGGLETALTYLRAFAGVYGIQEAQLERLAVKVTFLEPREQGEEYRLSDEKRQFDSATYGFYQTFLNVPVWRAGLKVSIKLGPSRVIQSESTRQLGIQASMPSKSAITRYQKLFETANAASLQIRAVAARPELRAAAAPDEGAVEAGKAGEDFLRKILKFPEPAKGGRTSARLIRGRFWIYRYDARDRLRKEDQDAFKVSAKPKAERGAVVRQRRRGGSEADPARRRPPFDIGAVDPEISDGAYYMVGEVTFEVVRGTEQGTERGTWRALVDLETGSVLYLRPLSGDVTGLVFDNDPITKTGLVNLTSSSGNTVLNGHRDRVTLGNLSGPGAGGQALSGSHAYVTQVEGVDIAPPIQAGGVDFDYDARTNEFASVSGYFHTDRVFETIEGLGFVLAYYLPNTIRPIPVDIRCVDWIDAHCYGDGMGGIGHLGFGLMDETDLAHPLGRACDPRVYWHELCGHGILYEHVDAASFHFAHSAGDGLSAIFFDPDSNCKGVDGAPVKPGDLRFTYAPWHPWLDRRFDRGVAAGWAWGGQHDDRGYGSEEILSTTHFNIYRSIGGDSDYRGRRQFASRMMLYLILRAVGDLTPATNPMYAREFAAALMGVDAFNWTSEGVFGGAYHKVIRWAFEKQGEYQSPLVVLGRTDDVTAPGDPPEVDVYINDGRSGEYRFQEEHWQTLDIWNRRHQDGLLTHQAPIPGQTNFAYAKIRSRGTLQAHNVTVRAFHSRPGAGLNWPGDFVAMDTAQINVAALGPNGPQSRVVGPFEWEPLDDVHGYDGLLMIVSADGDAANVDHLAAGESMPEWRLVPNDNNVAQRHVHLVPGGGGGAGLIAALDGVSFGVGNPNPEPASMELEVRVPALLTTRHWALAFDGIQNNSFPLASGAKQDVTIRVTQGQNFNKTDVKSANDRDVTINVVANENVIGGITFRLDPNLQAAVNPA